MSQVAHLYKITNKVTGEYYLGKHNGWTQDTKSRGLYWGSGNRIKNQIKKYGKNNFRLFDFVLAGLFFFFYHKN